jgi:glutamyl-tRNA synthetase
MSGNFVGRLAPSPTGTLHLGNVRTFMWAWLAARQSGGRVLMRIEDLETPRVKPGVTARLLDDLRWLGFDWDGDLLFQTQRREYYRSVFERLHAQGALYRCVCTRSEMLAALHGAPHAGEHELRYPGTCSTRSDAQIDELARSTGREPVWRVKTAPGTTRFDDLLYGPQSIDVNAEIGDFIVSRASDNPAYQLAVVADDIATGVNLVVRGDDLRPSTARQLLLYKLLDAPPPTFGHAPLLVGPDGRRLAKRHGDARISTYRERGVTAERIVGTLARWSGLADKDERSLRDLLPVWSWQRVNKERVVLTAAML